MRAILLAAGRGERLRPVTEHIPKCLVAIRDTPLLDIWCERLAKAGIGPVLVNTHYLADVVHAHVAQRPYRDDVTLVREPSLLGTGGTVLANRDFVGREAFFLAHADNLCVCDLRAFVAAHTDRSSGVVITMMTFATDSPATCGIVELDDRGCVTAFHEKVPNPPGNRANGAVYIVEPEVIDFMQALARPVIDFSLDVIPHFLGRIGTWHNSGIHRDIGSLQSLAAAQHEVF